MKGWTALLLAAFLAFPAALLGGTPAQAFEGRVLDAKSGAPIAGATVTLDGHVVTSNSAGAFAIEGSGDTLELRAPGYQRLAASTAALAQPDAELRLTPFAPKALYLSFFGVGSTTLRQAAFALIHRSQLNALVIDIKGDRGLIAYPSAVPLAGEIGARQMTTIRDLPALVKLLHDEGVYAIARIVVFKDNPLATARPDLAVRYESGGIFRDREKLAWVDPFKREVWDYDIAIAEEAARAGFDEIQFDYLRFPDATGLRFAEASTQAARVKAITGFLAEARQRLARYNVFIAADIFGYVCWNLDDTHIGQRIEDIVPLVDYVSPMLYPSGFQFGIPGYRNPVEHPYEIVRLSLDRALARTKVSPKRFRPWLQAFKDYGFDRRMFDSDEVRIQIKAAEDAGTDGWMLWNPRNVYSDIGF